MDNINVERKTSEWSRTRRRKKAWQRVLAGMMAVVVFSTTYALILPAITKEQEVFCGHAEHEHGEACYERVLICGYPAEEQGASLLLGGTHAAQALEGEETEYATTDADAGDSTDPDAEDGQRAVEDAGPYDGDASPAPAGEETGDPTAPAVPNDGILTSPAAPQNDSNGDASPAGEESVTPSPAPVEPAHVHTEACYEQRLACGHEAHAHSLACFSNPEADLESEESWTRSVAAVELSGDWAADLVAIAESQLGNGESANNYAVNENGEKQGYTRYGAWWGAANAYDPWCAMFVSFCLNYAGIPETAVPRDSGCIHWQETLAMQGLWREPDFYTPAAGDLIFFDYDFDAKADHVGLVYALEQDEEEGLLRIVTIEGNNSTKVEKYTYELNDERILGYAALPVNPELPQPVEPVSLSAVAENGIVVTLTADPESLPYPIEELWLSVTLVEDEAVEALVKDAVAESAETGDPTDVDASNEGILTSPSAPQNDSNGEASPAGEGSTTAPDVAPVPSDASPTEWVAQEEEEGGSGGEAFVNGEAGDGSGAERASSDDVEGSRPVSQQAPAPRQTVLFDIKIMHGDEEVQPLGPVSVSFSGFERRLDEAQVFHVDPEAGTLEDMNAAKEENGSEVAIETEHFSIYALSYSYTVDFYFGDYEFHIPGESSVWLSELFAQLGIERSAADVVSVVFTDPTLLKIEQMDNNGSPDWLLTSLAPFSTDEKLTITFSDGEVLEIRVTDAAVAGTWGSVEWFISDAGWLHIKPLNNAPTGVMGNGMPPWLSYREWITYVAFDNLPNGSKPKVYANEATTHLFAGCTELTSIDFNGNFDTSRATSMVCWFYDCKKLESLDLSFFNTASVVTMYRMFSETRALQTLDLSSFRSTSLTNTAFMFTGCPATLTLPPLFDCASVTIANDMFNNGCPHHDLRYLDMRNAQHMFQFFAAGDALKSVRLGPNFVTRAGAQASFPAGTWLWTEGGDGEIHSADEITGWLKSPVSVPRAGLYTRASRYGIFLDQPIWYSLRSVADAVTMTVSNSSGIAVHDRADGGKNICWNWSNLPKQNYGSNRLPINPAFSVRWSNMAMDPLGNYYDLVVNFHDVDVRYFNNSSGAYSSTDAWSTEYWLVLLPWGYHIRCHAPLNPAGATMKVACDAAIYLPGTDTLAPQGPLVFGGTDLDSASVVDRDAGFPDWAGVGAYGGPNCEGVNLIGSGWDFDTLTFADNTTLTTSPYGTGGLRISGTQHDNESDCSTFLIVANSTGFSYEWTANNAAYSVFPIGAQPKPIWLQKIDTVSKKLLNGARLELWDLDSGGNETIHTVNGVESRWNSTDENPKGFFLIPGNYRFKEIVDYPYSVPQYHRAAADIDFRVDPDYNLHLIGSSVGLVDNDAEEGTVSLLAMQDDPWNADLIIYKQDLAGNPIAATAKFMVSGTYDGVRFERLSEPVPGEDGKYIIKNIPYSNGTGGPWTLEEIEPPAGYGLSGESYQIEVKADGEVELNGNVVSSVTFRNPLEGLNGNLYVKKVSTDGTLLPNATFTLTDNNSPDPANPLVYTRVTGDGGNLGPLGIASFRQMPLGVYTLAEADPPEGYKAIAETWTVTIARIAGTDNVSVTVNPSTGWDGSSNTLTVVNTPNNVTLKITKNLVGWVPPASDDGGDGTQSPAFGFNVVITPPGGSATTQSFTLQHNQSKSITVPVGADVTITENGASGYLVTWEETVGGTPTTGTGTSYTITGMNENHDVTVTNTVGEPLPNSGGLGTALPVAFGLMTMAGALSVGLARRRKRIET